MSINKCKLRTLSLAVGVAVAAAVPMTASADLTGNIGVVSKYVLRGITNNAENDGTAVQGGLDFTAGGFYLGYWGSNLDYGNTATATGFENDIYAGYKFGLGPVTLNVGAIYYYYTEVDDSDAPEAVLAASFGPVTLGVKYLADDVVWGNQGDMYLTADFAQALPANFNFGASLGYYVYDDSDPGEPGTIPAGTTTEDSAFRHLNLTISHPIAKDSATMSVTYIVGGKDRTGTDQKDAVVLGLSTTF